MRKLYVLGFTVIALFAFGTVTASAAFAEPEWLIDLEPVAELTSVEGTGLLTFTDLKTAVGVAVIHCEGILDGTIGPKGEDEVTEVLNAAGKLIEELKGEALLCEGVEGCIKNATDTEVWPENLPWHTQLELMTSGEILDLVVGTPGYTVLCLVLGGLASAEDTCINENGGSATLENMATESDVLAIVQEENSQHCTQSGENVGDVQGEGLVFTLSGLTLEVSETGEE